MSGMIVKRDTGSFFLLIHDDLPAEPEPGAAGTAFLQKLKSHLCVLKILHIQHTAGLQTHALRYQTIKNSRLVRFAFSLQTVRTGGTEVVRALRDPDLRNRRKSGSGSLPQYIEDGFHPLLKGFAVTVPPVVLYAHQMVGAQVYQGRGIGLIV